MTSVVDILMEEMRLWLFPNETDDMIMDTVDVTCMCHRHHPSSEQKV